MSFHNERYKGGSAYELINAMHTLLDAHTNDDRHVGFTVETTPSFITMGDRSAYIEAWRIVRDALGYRTSPQRENEEPRSGDDAAHKGKEPA